MSHKRPAYTLSNFRESGQAIEFYRVDMKKVLLIMAGILVLPALANADSKSNWIEADRKANWADTKKYLP